MIDFISASCTDIGGKRRVNQDGYCIKVAQTDSVTIAFAAICDGMGGLSKGELASTNVVTALSNWFDEEMPALYESSELSFDAARDAWDRLIVDQNSRLSRFAATCGEKIGTTLTAIMFIDEEYMLVHIGDSRVYRVTDGISERLTADQTVAAREVQRRNMTEEQAARDPKSHVLLQCVGASKVLVPEYAYGSMKASDVVLLCTDGFYRKLDNETIVGQFGAAGVKDESKLEAALDNTLKIIKQRAEPDNISAIAIKLIGR